MPIIAELLVKQANPRFADVLSSTFKDPNTLKTILGGAAAGGLLGATVSGGRANETPAEHRARILRNAGVFALGGAGAGLAGKAGLDLLTDPKVAPTDLSPGSLSGAPFWIGGGAAAGGAIGGIKAELTKGVQAAKAHGNTAMSALTERLNSHPLLDKPNLNADQVAELMKLHPDKAVEQLGVFRRSGLPGPGAPSLDGATWQELVRTLNGDSSHVANAFTGTGKDIHTAYLGLKTPVLRDAARAVRLSPMLQAIGRPAGRAAAIGGLIGGGITGGKALIDSYLD